MARKRIQLKQIRKILQLKYESGLSIRDTAKLSGASKTTVSVGICIRLLCRGVFKPEDSQRAARKHSFHVVKRQTKTIFQNN
jgi:hypothetical protein